MKALHFLIAMIAAFAGCSKSERIVVVYTSQDQVYAEPLLAEFTRQTGIKVLPVFDSESVKTAGLVQRLLAEKDNPRADVFWSNEEMLSWQLVDRGILNSNHWAKAGFRTRRLIVNTNRIAFADAPKNLSELADPKWSGRIALAYPVYGTTAAHMVALRQSWGDAKWKQWCEGLAANKPFVVDGNSLVVKLVGAGEAWLGLTDSDDFAAGIHNELPIASLPVTAEFLRIPNSIGIVNGAPHRSEAEEFFKFARAEKTLGELVNANALEGVACAGAGLAQPAPVEETRELLKTIFARR
jgi:iron(III) transport system substrate-binding protein